MSSHLSNPPIDPIWWRATSPQVPDVEVAILTRMWIDALNEAARALGVMPEHVELTRDPIP